MRSLLLLTVLAACELKPPPPKADVPAGSGSALPMAAKAPAIAPTPAPAPAPTPMPVPETGSGSAAPIPQPVISEACATLAVHITDVLIANAEPSQRPFLEQERGRTVRQSGISCQRNNWSADKIKCFSAALKAADLDACNKLP